MRKIIISLAIVMGVGVALVPEAALAVDTLNAVCTSGSEAANTAVCQSKGESLTKFVGKLVDGLLYILGALCVVVIIIAGIFYATSGGNSAQVEKAKNTILYAVVGLVVAASAYAIVHWILSRL